MSAAMAGAKRIVSHTLSKVVPVSVFTGYSGVGKGETRHKELEGTSVRFVLSDGQQIRIDTSEKRPGQLMVFAEGGKRLFVSPEAGNCVSLMVQDEL